MAFNDVAEVLANDRSGIVLMVVPLGGIFLEGQKFLRSVGERAVSYVVEEIGIRFRVTLRTAQVQSVTLDETDRAIVALVRAPEGLATRQIADKIGLTPRATRTRLAALVALGLMREIGTGPQDPKRRYFSTEAP